MIKKSFIALFTILFVLAMGWLCRGCFIQLSTPTEADALTYRRAHLALNTLDPAHGSDTSVNSAMSLVFQPLLEYSYTERPYKLIPGAAEALPTCNEDGTVYTFRLREAYYVDDPCFKGKRRRVTAHDFVYGWKRLADKSIGGSGYWIVANIKGIPEFSAKSADLMAELHGFTESKKEELLKERRVELYQHNVEGLVALDDKTLQVTLSKPNNQFLWCLTMCYMAPIPPEAEAYYGKQLAKHPVGAGPYKLRSWKRGYEMVFDRNPEWFGWKDVDFNGPEVPFETIRYCIVKNALTQWLMLLNGQLDFLEQIDRSNMDVAVDPEKGLTDEIKARGVKLFVTPANKVYYLGINTKDKVLGPNKKLRQALNAAFCSDAWKKHYRGRAERLDSVVPHHLEGALQKPFAYRYDLDKAKALLAEAGYPGGIDPTTGKQLRLTVEVGNDSVDTAESMELLASFYAQMGVKLEISVNTWQALQDKIRSGNAQLFLMGWVGDYPDLETFLQLFISKNTPTPNYSNFTHAEVDACYERAVASRNPEEIAACWTRIQEIILDECPWVLLHSAIDFTLVRDRVLNYIPHNYPYGMEKHYRVKNPRYKR